MKVEAQGDTLWFDGVDPQVLLKLPCAKKRRTGEVTMPATLGAMGVLATELPRLVHGSKALHLRVLRNELTHRLKMLKAGVVPPYPATKTVPWAHQAMVYWMAVARRSYGLFMDMGTGKSKVAVDLVETQELSRVLIVCPKAVIPVWETQFTQHGDGKTRVVLLNQGTVSQRRQAALDAVQAHTSGRLALVVNYDSVWRDGLAELWPKIRFDGIVADEAHKLKGVSSKVSVFLAKLAATVPHKYALTGTPFPEAPVDIYGIARFLDPTVFGISYEKFLTRYADYTSYGLIRKFKKLKDAPAFNERMLDIGVVVDKSVLTLPPIHHVPVPVDLDTKAREKYEEMERDAVTVIDNVEISAPHKITQMLRLQQMSGGYVRRSNDTVKQLHTAKLDALSELIDGLPADERVVVFGYFTDEMRAIQQLLLRKGRTAGRISGEGSDYVPWRDGKMQDLVVQIKSGGAGIDLSQACTAIYYSTGFALADYEQSLARLHRPGQTRTTTIYHLIARGTIDRYVYRALRTKGDLVQACMEGLKHA